MNVPSWLGRAAATQPDRTALETEAGSLTYAELYEATAGVDLPPGERVAIALPPGLDFAVALHACLRAGAVAVPVDLRLTERERAVVCAGAALAIAGPLRSGDRHDRPSSRGHDLDAPAAVIHTSGTTGPPRPVALTYGNLLWSALGSATAIGLDPAERWLCPLPVAHVGGLSILVRSAIYATTAVVHERFDTAAVLAALMDEGITVVSLVPTTLARLLDAGLRDPPHLRCALIGGAPLLPALTARALAAGIPVSQTYGLSEAASQVTTQRPGDGGDDAGPPLFCTRVRIVDGEINVAGPTLAPRGEPDPAGEIELAEPAVASGRDPDPAAGPSGPVPDGTGSRVAWLATGDLGELVDGRLRVTGRWADTIVSGGENIAPTEVEAALADHPSVAEAAALGVPDPDWGESVRAFVVLREGGPPVDGAELRAHCRERLAAFKVPKEFVFVEALPRTRSGKLVRRELAVERSG